MLRPVACQQGVHRVTRIYERDTDQLFATSFAGNTEFGSRFLHLIDGDPDNGVTRISQQTRHRGGHGGSIDLELQRRDGGVLLIENKIDAAYSVTREGDAQPERYHASVDALQERGMKAASVLLAPEIYLQGSRHAHLFDHRISYESLRPALTGPDLALLDAAILQAATPYDPAPNAYSGAFFAEYEAFVSRHFPSLVMKPNPNGNGVRPTESRTIYFDVQRTLRIWSRLPRPRMSLQCRDSYAPSASVKIMLGDGRSGLMKSPFRPNLPTWVATSDRRANLLAW